MTLEFLFYLAAGACAGGFVNGLAGFGTSLFALGWWLQVMPPVQAVAISLVMSVASGLQGVVLVHRSIDWRRLSRFMIPAVIGVPIGIGFLADVNPMHLKLVVAGFLILYGGFFAFRRSLPKLTRPTPVIDMGVGFIGGILGAIGGLSGALPTMWCSMRPWSKMEQRAVLQPFNVVILSLATGLLWIKGGYDLETTLSIAAAFPVTLISAQVGITVFKRLTDDHFRRLLIVLMLISGLVLLLRELPWDVFTNG
ncbi:sulfite exporter TauE/SafE family protein [Pelagibius sp. Alg239-R121]|uniref:sulfite exporter TauE/SafE family protein n=1 Tax=Pelagibius sp. Alg239-R121 TaxID=2993448 RepID=UPI0024A71AD5|nr:sulfite exporter TauE/SafE family protein [Pelagibius sp. Alg239-R121]